VRAQLDWARVNGPSPNSGRACCRSSVKGRRVWWQLFLRTTLYHNPLGQTDTMLALRLARRIFRETGVGFGFTHLPLAKNECPLGSKRTICANRKTRRYARYTIAATQSSRSNRGRTPGVNSQNEYSRSWNSARPNQRQPSKASLPAGEGRQSPVASLVARHQARPKRQPKRVTQVPTTATYQMAREASPGHSAVGGVWWSRRRKGGR